MRIDGIFPGTLCKIPVAEGHLFSGSSGGIANSRRRFRQSKRAEIVFMIFVAPLQDNLVKNYCTFGEGKVALRLSDSNVVVSSYS